MAGTPNDGGGYYVDLTGQVVAVPAPQEGEALQQGFVPASSEQVADVKLQEKYGGAGQQVLSGLEGAAQTLSLGMSTHAEKALGVPVEDIAGREAANPAAHGVGEGVGVAIPIAATLGAAALPEAAVGAAELTAPSLIGRAGGAAAEAAGALLPKATTALGRIGVGLAKGAASGLTEGALYGAGHVVHEAALGDPNLTATSALEEVGLSGLLGGGLGGGGSILGGLLKEAGSSNLARKVADWLPEFEAERNIKAAGGIQSDIAKAEGRMGRDALHKISLEARDLGIVSDLATPASVAENAAAVKASAGKAMGDILDEADAAGARPNKIENVVGRIRKGAIRELEDNPFASGAAKKLAGEMDALEAKFTEAGGPGLKFGDLHGVRRQIDDELFGLLGDKTPAATHAKRALWKARSVVSEEIDQGLERAGRDSEAWRGANREYRVASTFERFAQKGMQRAAGNNIFGLNSVISGAAGMATHGVSGAALFGLGAEGVKRYGSALLGTAARGVRQFLAKGAIGEVAGKTAELIAAERAGGANTLAQGVSRMPETAAAMSHLERANKAVAGRIDEAVKALVTGTGKVARAGVGKASAGAAAAITSEHIAQIAQLAQNPERLQDTLIRATKDLQEHAPQTTQALQVTASRAIAFLHGKAPKLPPALPLMRQKMKLGNEQLWRFRRYFDAVQKPTSILKHAAAGTLTPMDVEAVKTVHPELHQKMVMAALDTLTSHKGPIPYRRRLMVAMLLGQDVDGTLTPESIRANQATFDLPSSKSGMDATTPQPSMTGMGKVKVAQRAMLPGQASDSRRMEG